MKTKIISILLIAIILSYVTGVTVVATEPTADDSIIEVLAYEDTVSKDDDEIQTYDIEKTENMLDETDFDDIQSNIVENDTEDIYVDIPGLLMRGMVGPTASKTISGSSNYSSNFTKDVGTITRSGYITTVHAMYRKTTNDVQTGSHSSSGIYKNAYVKSGSSSKWAWKDVDTTTWPPPSKYSNSEVYSGYVGLSDYSAYFLGVMYLWE